jgi:hypothetical protein
MTPPDTDPYGSTETTTEYKGQRRPGSSSGYAISAWAVGFAAVFLMLVAGWFFFHPAGPDPAPGGSAGNGVVRTPGPTSSRP